MSTKFALCLLAALVVLARADIPNTIVQTQSGSVQGYVDLLTGTQIWRGIPFAAPPVSHNRFRAPQPAAPWNGTRSAALQASICTQLHIGLLNLGSEDCLYLDVYVPPNTDANANLPVMVWFFGGGYSIGDGWEFGFYDGANLARKRNVIIVAPNYRVGPFGFMSLPELQQEDGSNGSTGNYGLQDQQAALRWVAANVRAFGGNPDQVMIFGESAGAFSVCWHLVSPQSTGLFRAALMESGTCDAPQFFQNAEIAAAYSRNWMASVGCNRANFSDPDSYLTCVRYQPTSVIMSGAVPVNSPQSPLAPIMPWGPTIDGSVYGLLGTPLKLIQSGKWNQVPLVLGTNKDEGTLFVPAMFLLVPGTHFPLQEGDLKPLLVHFFFNETFADQILEVYPNDGTATPDDRAAAVLRDYFFACANRRIARSLSAQDVPAYLYHFSYKGDWIDDLILGDYHASELAYVWDNPWPAIVHAFSANDQAISDIMTEYWTNFAKTLNPNGNSSQQLAWPLYQTQSDQNIVLELPPTIQSSLYAGTCEFWDQNNNHANHYSGVQSSRVRTEAQLRWTRHVTQTLEQVVAEQRAAQRLRAESESDSTADSHSADRVWLRRRLLEEVSRRIHSL